tara:strand:- start:11045 stop:11929 length:885 start_codon:yes stop_codon:yes gene_type:complete
MNEIKNVIVSIIIPTFNDDISLQKCINSIAEQDFSKNNLEVIIINNNPSVTLNVDTSLLSIVKIVSEERPGSYAARNTGVSHAAGDYFLFTDSDCILNNKWISSAVEYLTANPKHRVVGPIELYYKDKKKTIAECYESVFSFRQFESAAKSISITANVGISRESYFNVGLFNDELFSGGDVEWSLRARDKGIPVKIIEGMEIYHPARNNISDLIKKRRRVIGGDYSRNKNKWNSPLRIFLWGLVFPISEIREALSCCKINYYERIKASLMCYFIRLYTSMYMIKLIKTETELER